MTPSWWSPERVYNPFDEPTELTLSITKGYDERCMNIIIGVCVRALEEGCACGFGGSLHSLSRPLACGRRLWSR
jgi:hypothetical protein